jgi:hypothetical protein
MAMAVGLPAKHAHTSTFREGEGVLTAAVKLALADLGLDWY